MTANSAAQPIERIPVLLDTDLGADIDDAFALGLALGSFELEVRGLTSVGADAQQRAMMLCRFLTVTGRRHMPVPAGADPQPPRPITSQHKYYYHPDVLFDRTKKTEASRAAEFLLQRLKEQPGKITLLALGPLTNVARLLGEHAEAAAQVKRIVLVESNVSHDPEAAKRVFASGILLIVVTQKACRELTLDDSGLHKVFAPGTALSRQVEALHQMWDGGAVPLADVPLADVLATALCIDERLATLVPRRLATGEQGLHEEDGAANALVVDAVNRRAFLDWYVSRMASLVSPERAPSRPVAQGDMPRRVHVAEDFDNDIERRWWMSGKPETRVLPAGGRRACRGVLTHDFDDLLMLSRQMYTAVIFNPVPGPPMGQNTRLSFRCWLKGTDSVRVQIYSLSNGYHRQLVVAGLPQESWQAVTVDLTQARRPDGTGGPLSENERIDDIQFYADAGAELVIDDIVLYEAAAADEQRPFPQRVVFTAWFDTGKQGAEWPGDFDLAPDAGNFWRAARSVKKTDSGLPWIRLGLRGQRRLGERTHVSLRFRLAGAESFDVRLVDTATGHSKTAAAGRHARDEWGQTTLEFDTADLPAIDELHLLPDGELLPEGGELLVDDVLIYEPGAE